MNILLYFIGPILVVLILNPILSSMYKDEEKNDKGFVLNYHRLTYRRKMIRTLWGIPFITLLFLVIYWIGDLSSIEYIILGIVFFSLLLMGFVHNYVKWIKNEKYV
ncbi:hypothetical protein AHA02nite_13940 [Alkalibacillus haloalkaliphilus]|uniref:Uncharacterized protein n=1 Tax=Alkalibacillus haloalkaliphilus TaxID=94136 RepID=A0A511W5P7_9BACI|nr:hypothetical protein AHA02nite_13940 [Alkalibacillus haloalkaliphilus]